MLFFLKIKFIALSLLVIGLTSTSIGCALIRQPVSTRQSAVELRTAKETESITADLEKMEFAALVQKQMNLEPYMTRDIETDIVTFDVTQAREAGHEESIIALAEEMVAYQNLMMTKMRETGINDVTQVEVDIEPFPLVERFQARVNEQMDKARKDAPPIDTLESPNR